MQVILTHHLQVVGTADNMTSTSYNAGVEAIRLLIAVPENITSDTQGLGVQVVHLVSAAPKNITRELLDPGQVYLQTEILFLVRHFRLFHGTVLEL